jgi:hypothetical protein
MSATLRVGFIFMLVAIFGGVITSLAGQEIPQAWRLGLAAAWVLWFFIGSVMVAIGQSGDNQDGR